uniref:Protein C10 n=1 Tax=Anopheles dirus TaxID=7168 RepID=A0A182NTK5_9DIPT
MSYLSNFNAETGKTILVDILKTVNQPENSKKLSEAKANSGKEMIKMMQYVFPLVMQLQIEVIKDYGFPGSREGLVQFEQIIREFEREDVDIARLRAQIRSIYLPPININSSTNDVLI